MTAGRAGWITSTWGGGAGQMPCLGREAQATTGVTGSGRWWAGGRGVRRGHPLLRARLSAPLFIRDTRATQDGGLRRPPPHPPHPTARPRAASALALEAARGGGPVPRLSCAGPARGGRSPCRLGRPPPAGAAAPDLPAPDGPGQGDRPWRTPPHSLLVGRSGPPAEPPRARATAGLLRKRYSRQQPSFGSQGQCASRGRSLGKRGRRSSRPEAASNKPPAGPR